MDCLKPVNNGAIIRAICLIMEISDKGERIMVINHVSVGGLEVSIKKIKVGCWLRWGGVWAGLALLWWFRQPVLDLLRIVSNREAVSIYLGHFGLVGPLLLSLILVLQVIVAAIPGHILMISGGYVYGFWTAFCINLLA